MMSIIEKAKRGIPLEDMLIIDCHCHMGYWHNFNVLCGSAEGMLTSMDALGIDIACVTAHSSIGPDYRYGNDLVIDTVKKYPGRFVGYATINPNYPDDMQNELDRCFLISGIKGIKLHPDSHGCPIDYENYRIVYETADEKKCPVLIHVWGSGEVAAIDRLAGQYPGAQFIMGHAGGDIRSMESAINVVNKHGNVYVDLALSTVFEGNVEWLVMEMGSKKVLYGSDMPFFDPRPAFGRVALANISEELKKDVFGMNMIKLLNMQVDI
jgi:Predicted metal-dependent hydrolase of the TIM-barrel fold